MSAQFDSTPGLHLPQPSPGGMQQPAQPMAPMPVQPQQPSFMPQQPMAPTTAVTPNPATQPQATQFVQQQPAQVQAAAPVAIDPMQAATIALQQPVVQPEVSDNEKDGDALDEEWVAKTKSLIEQYKNDPYALSNALSALKSDYMKARHGVTVKVDKT